MANKHNPVAAVMAEHLPGKGDHAMVHLSVGSIRSMLQAGVAQADALHQAEAQRTLNGFLGPLMGCGLALEGIADAADTLLQQDPEQGASMLAELVKSVQARLESVTEAMESASQPGRQV